MKLFWNFLQAKGSGFLMVIVELVCNCYVTTIGGLCLIVPSIFI